MDDLLIGIVPFDLPHIGPKRRSYEKLVWAGSDCLRPRGEGQEGQVSEERSTNGAHGGDQVVLVNSKRQNTGISSEPCVLPVGTVIFPKWGFPVRTTCDAA